MKALKCLVHIYKLLLRGAASHIVVATRCRTYKIKIKISNLAINYFRKFIGQTNVRALQLIPIIFMYERRQRRGFFVIFV